MFQLILLWFLPSNNPFHSSPFLYANARPVSLGVYLLILLSLIASCDFKATNANEPAFDIEQYNGRWLILNYWADWCAPCRKEIIELNALSINHATTIAVLGVNFDGAKGTDLSEQIRSMGIEFPNLEVDPAEPLRLSRPASLPTTYIFNPGGELAFKLVGPQTEQSLLERIAMNL